MYRYDFVMEELDVSLVTGSAGSIPIDALNGLTFLAYTDGLVKFFAFLPHGKEYIHSQVIVEGDAEKSAFVASEVCSYIVSHKWTAGRELRFEKVIEEVMDDTGLA